MPAKHRASPQVLMQASVRSPSTPWNILLLRDEDGRNRLEEWSAGVSLTGHARRDTTIKFLRAEPQMRWDRPHASSLGNNAYVIRFKDQTGYQHRLFGFFSLVHHAFVICLAGYEVGSKYHPTDYAKRVEKCRALGSDALAKRLAKCPWAI